MSIRVSDPDIPAARWLALVIMSLTMMVPGRRRVHGGKLLGAAFMFLHRARALRRRSRGVWACTQIFFSSDRESLRV